MWRSINTKHRIVTIISMLIVSRADDRKVGMIKLRAKVRRRYGILLREFKNLTGWRFLNLRVIGKMSPSRFPLSIILKILMSIKTLNLRKSQRRDLLKRKNQINYDITLR